MSFWEECQWWITSARRRHIRIVMALQRIEENQARQDSTLWLIRMQVGLLAEQGVEIMTRQDEIATLIGTFNTETNRLATLIEDLLAQQARTDLTDAEEEAVVVQFQAIADRLKAVGANPQDPVPEPA